MTQSKTIFTALTFFLFICSTVAQTSTEDLHSQWIAAMNAQEDLTPFYSSKSGLLSDDKLVIGNGIEQTLLNGDLTKTKIQRFESLDIQQLRDQQKFEMGICHTQDNDRYLALIGWKNESGWFKEFEAICRMDVSAKDEREKIDNPRTAWEKFSNQHRPDLLVESVFTQDGKYLNRGKVFVGKEIVDGYSYMTNENYRITLTPLYMTQATDSMIYEIGVFETGGKGLYALIWQKVDGDWKLLQDFNF